MSTSATRGGGQAAIPTIPVICDTCRAQGHAGAGDFAGIADILNFEPVPRRTQVNNWTPELQRAFIAALAITGSAKRAGKAIGRHEIGAEKLRKARGGKGFDEAWDAAIDLYREREQAKLHDQMAELSSASLEQAQQLDRGPGEADWDEQDDAYAEVRERTRERLLNARRLFLMLICSDPEQRAAWEVLVGPTDWDKAERREPQDDEALGIPSMRKPDMLITAEAGLMHGMLGCGPDLIGEIEEAANEMRATGRDDGPAMRRLCGEEE